MERQSLSYRRNVSLNFGKVYTCLTLEHICKCARVFLYQHICLFFIQKMCSFFSLCLFGAGRFISLAGLNFLFGIIYFNIDSSDVGGISSLVAAIFMAAAFCGMCYLHSPFHIEWYIWICAW